MKKCPVCGKGIFGSGEVCITCEKDNKKGMKKNEWANKQCCVSDCIDTGFQPLNDLIYCYRHYQKAYAQDYKPKATQDQISRFLIKMGSKSEYWKRMERLKPEWCKAAIEYYKSGKVLETVSGNIVKRSLEV